MIIQSYLRQDPVDLPMNVRGARKRHSETFLIAEYNLPKETT